MTIPKIKWRVAPAPTGRYRSFEHRSWPSAEYSNGQLAAQIICEHPFHSHYYPSVAKSGNHPPLTLLVYDYSAGVQARKCLRLKTKCANVQEAKELLAAFLQTHQHFIPAEFRAAQPQGDTK